MKLTNIECVLLLTIGGILLSLSIATIAIAVKELLK